MITADSSEEHSASQTISAVYGIALILYGLHLTVFGVWLLLGKISLGVHGLYYVAPGVVLWALGSALWLGHTWPALPAFAVSLVPGLWPLLWSAAGYRSLRFLWGESFPLIAPAAFAVIAAVHAALTLLGRRRATPIRVITAIYATLLSLYSLFLLGSGVWISLYVHRHAPFEVLYLVPGAILAFLSIFLWLGHAWPGPALAASVVPGIWPTLWTFIAAGRMPVHLSWEAMLLLVAPAVFGALSGTCEEGWPEARSRGLCLPHHHAEQLGGDHQP